MANLIFAQYIDDAIIYDVGTQVAYHYVGTTASAPNADVADITEQNIPAFTFQAADPQGKQVYSKCEHAVSFYLDVNYKEVECTNANQEYTLFTAPAAGVIRVYSLVSAGNFGIIVYVNGTQVGAAANVTVSTVPYANKGQAVPFNLNNGDVVSVKINQAGRFAYCGFLPDTY